MSGLSVQLGGIGLTLLVAADDEAVEALVENHVFRPTHLNLFQEADVKSIGLGWPGQNTRAVWFSRGDPNASIPRTTSVS